MQKRYLLLTIAVIVSLSLLAAAATLFAADKKAIKWSHDFEKAAKEARKVDKPIMADFYADWCPPCRKLNSDTFTDSRVIDLSRKFVCVKVNVDKNRKLAEKYEIEGIPTIIFFNSKSKEIHRIVGYRDADDFLQEMRKALKKIK